MRREVFDNVFFDEGYTQIGVVYRFNLVADSGDYRSKGLDSPSARKGGITH